MAQIDLYVEPEYYDFGYVVGGTLSLATASIVGNATVLCLGVRIGDNWGNVAGSDNSWSDVSIGDNTWSDVSVGDNTWETVSVGSNDWADKSTSENIWLRQG
jgi:hypothetical protein